MIEVKHLTKLYGEHTAVSDLSFTIEDGRIYGFLGPNGAGKSTTMNIMTGCLAATSGDVSIDGHDIFEDAGEAKRSSAIFRSSRRCTSTARRGSTCNLSPRQSASPRAISSGRSRRLWRSRRSPTWRTGSSAISRRATASASASRRRCSKPKGHHPDEPTVGLDPKQIVEIRELIKSLGREHTVVLSSHILRGSGRVRHGADNLQRLPCRLRHTGES